MDKKNNITEKYDGRNPFRVPDGYFENLTGRIMENIPDETRMETLEARNRSARNNKYIFGWFSVAAACIAVVFMLMAFPADNKEKFTGKQIAKENSRQQPTEDNNETYDEQYQSDLMEYNMIDNEDIYCYLSGAMY